MSDLLLYIPAGLCPHPKFSFAPHFIVCLELFKWKCIDPGHKYVGWGFTLTCLVYNICRLYSLFVHMDSFIHFWIHP